MAALIANQSASNNHLPSYIAYNSKSKAINTQNNQVYTNTNTNTNTNVNSYTQWWRELPSCMAAMKETASQIRWFKYYDHQKKTYLPVTSKQIASINISKKPHNNIITMQFYYLNPTSDDKTTPIHSTIFKFEPTYINPNGSLSYKINCPLVSFNRHNTHTIYSAIHSFVNELEYMIYQIATIEFPPTSINIYAVYHTSNPISHISISAASNISYISMNKGLDNSNFIHIIDSKTTNNTSNARNNTNNNLVSSSRCAYGTSSYYNTYFPNNTYSNNSSSGYWELQPTYHIGNPLIQPKIFTGAMRYIY